MAIIQRTLSSLPAASLKRPTHITAGFGRIVRHTGTIQLAAQSVQQSGIGLLHADTPCEPQWFIQHSLWCDPNPGRTSPPGLHSLQHAAGGTVVI